MTQSGKSVPHEFSLEEFKKSVEDMIVLESSRTDRTREWIYESFYAPRDYTIEDVNNTIRTEDLDQKRILSNHFFYCNSYYREVISYYASLLKYVGIVIPNPVFGKSLQDQSLLKRYIQAQKFVEKLKLNEFGPRIALKVLLNGTYFGLIQTKTKKELYIIDLPNQYCRTRYKDKKDNLIVEFNVQYFDTIKDVEARKAALNTYPDEVRNYYSRYKKNKNTKPWIFLPTDIGFAFQLFDERPYFLSLIPSILQYEGTVDTEQLRALEEIKKILVHKIPHLNDGTLLFEPLEAKIMHNGVVQMLKVKNPYVSVLTTYGDVDIENTNTNETATSANNLVTAMRQNIYSSAGVSGEIFAATGSSALSTSIKYDLSLMMILANKIANFVKNIVNDLYENTSISFNYIVLPVSYFNELEYVDEYYKLAGSGYSFLLPIVAQGMTPSDLINLKTLEDDVFKLHDLMNPLKSSYTQSAEEEEKEDEEAEKAAEPQGEPGRPKVSVEKKAETTVTTEESRK